MLKNIETAYLDIVRKKRKDLFSFTLRLFLTPFGWILKAITKIRNLFYDYQLFSSTKPDDSVIISIGNIAVGGTGKTPVTLKLAKELSFHYPTAILSRGYRSSLESLATPKMISDGNGPKYPVDVCGDEPYILAKNLQDVQVFVGKNRVLSALMANANGAKAIVLDDGMQHRRLKRDFEIVVVDASDPLSTKKFLPAGLLRDNISSLSRANLIVCNHVSSIKEYESIIKLLRRYTSSAITAVKPKIAEIKTFNGKTVSSIAQEKLGYFCGIGNPAHFENMLKDAGAIIIDKLVIGDHKIFNMNELKLFAEKLKEKGCRYIACTEKDIVKLPTDLTLKLPIIWIKMTLEFVAGEIYWNDLVKEAKHLMLAR